jgi:hypothetical protein
MSSFISKQLEVYPSYRSGFITLAVYDYRLANRINRVLGYIDGRVQKGEEALFSILPPVLLELSKPLGAARVRVIAQALDLKIDLQVKRIQSEEAL